MTLATVPLLAAAGGTPRACDHALLITGTGVGDIPDGPLGGTVCGDPGPPLLVSFPVPGLLGLDVVDLDVSLDIQHTWLADLTVTLTAPNGTVHSLFGHVGAASATACGFGTDMDGTFVFSDFASPPFGGMWQAALANPGLLPPGSYFTTESGGAGAVHPMPATSIRSMLEGLDNAAGTWTLRVTDGGEGDLGTIQAATLRLCVDSSKIFSNGFEP